MPGKVFFNITMSLDGFMAPRSEPGDIDALRRGESTPNLERWMSQWSRLQAWVFPQRFFLESQHLGSGGEEGRDNDILRHTFERTSVSIMGKRMFEGGEIGWNDDAPFHTPVYVITHEQRDPWTRPGGTTFHFVGDGIHAALDRARADAGDGDIRIAGGAETIQQYLDAGLIDEFTLAIAPVLLGDGIRLFDNVSADAIAFEPVHVETSSTVTHVTYAVTRTATGPD
jgi:dihydrofolate reductase